MEQEISLSEESKQLLDSIVRGTQTVIPLSTSSANELEEHTRSLRQCNDGLSTTLTDMTNYIKKIAVENAEATSDLVIYDDAMRSLLKIRSFNAGLASAFSSVISDGIDDLGNKFSSLAETQKRDIENMSDSQYLSSIDDFKDYRKQIWTAAYLKDPEDIDELDRSDDDDDEVEDDENLYPFPEDTSLWFDSETRKLRSINDIHDQLVAQQTHSANQDVDGDIVISRIRENFICPITNAILEEAVTSSVCHHSYSKEAITQYLGSPSDHQRVVCPMQGCPLFVSSSDLQDDFRLRLRVRRHKARLERRRLRSLQTD
ncbi:uncharacterized protein V1516DRAFT_332929 [Lipomyces oligophaga]|uniref:uncharacterized protein n=1 Tax=Lipomyces oligophaga TaxID=45792 RepID=UPI0034D01ADC